MSVSALGSGTFGFDGVISNLQTTDIINKLISLEAQPINQLKKHKADIQARDAAYKAIRASLSTFQGAIKTLLLSGSIDARSVTTGTAGILTGTATTDATNGTYSVQVGRLATATTVTNVGPLSGGVNAASVFDAAGLDITPTAGTFTINGVQKTITAGMTISQVLTLMSTGTGVTATLVNGNYVKLENTPAPTSAPITLGAATDTSNILSAFRLVQPGESVLSIQSTGALKTVNTARPVSSAGLSGYNGLAGTLTINGVNIAYSAGDSLTAIFNRINASTAGVHAVYNPATDQVTLTNTATGTADITVSDGAGGNLGAALGLTTGTHTLGTTAKYSLNGGTTWSYSSSNTVTGAITGVTLTLTGVGTTTVTVAQDTSKTVTNVNAFISAFNSLVDLIDQDTAYDATSKKAAVLTGDSTVLSIQRSLRSMVSGYALVPSGSTYRALSDVGITTGAFGAAIGTTNHLQLDSSKLTTALQSNPAAVYAALSGLGGTLTTTGGNWVSTISGQPTGSLYGGTWDITHNGSTGLSSVYTPSGGIAQTAVTGTVAAGGNTTIVPGLLIAAKATPVAGTDRITWNVTTRGVLQALDGYLTGLLGTSGAFQAESDSAAADIKSTDAQITAMNDRLDQKRKTLQKQFTAMEVALSKIQGQGAQLISSLNNTGISYQTR